MTFFESRDLRVGYSGRIVVDGVNFQLKKGEILCLLGQNGSGKSTILKSITDHIDLLGGSIFISSRDINSISPKDRAKEMSVVLTERVTPELMTAEEIVALGRYPYTNYFGKLEEEDYRIIEESIKIVNGEDLRNKEFISLSDGEKQRILIARAISQQADTMILDEPTSYLDIRYKVELLNILKSLSIEKEKTIIMSLHEIDLVSKIADKVMLIKDGRVIKYGTPEEVVTDELIKEAYDLKEGSFDANLGVVELEKTSNKARVFVLGGGSKVNLLYRELNKKDIGFFSGVLFKNDLAFSVSSALAEDTVFEDSFVEIKDEKIIKCKEYIRTCKYLVDMGEDFVGINKRNAELLCYAKNQGIDILSLRKGDNINGISRFDNVSDIIMEILGEN